MNNAATSDRVVPLVAQEDERPALVEKIGKTTYRVKIYFSTTSRETMSDKIKRMLRNEVQRMQ
ncbi:transposon-encoded TnpW family protein [Scardovia inopinata]|uniref:transposon-encoded TnpW family protein n=1 Tax=Scardovia inopinata TaxID=78259 RepID=UPI000652FC74